jgi:hypothetical protein
MPSIDTTQVSPNPTLDVLRRLERCEQLLADYDQYIKALRARIAELEYTRAPTFTPYVSPVGGKR